MMHEPATTIQFDDDLRENNPNMGQVLFNLTTPRSIGKTLSEIKDIEKEIFTSNTTQAQEQRISEFKVLEPVIQKYMKVMRDGFKSRVA